jgi:hypothetical protein
MHQRCAGWECYHRLEICLLLLQVHRQQLLLLLLLPLPLHLLLLLLLLLLLPQLLLKLMQPQLLVAVSRRHMHDGPAGCCMAGCKQLVFCMLQQCRLSHGCLPLRLAAR